MKILILTWRDLKHPEAGGAEVYTEQIAKRWVAAGHHVTLLAADAPGLPARETIDGYEVVRVGGKYSKYNVYRAARGWWREEGQYQGFDLVFDMINTVPFQAHHWIKDIPTVALAHQTAEEIWFQNTPLPGAVLGRYLLEPRWLKSYADIPTLAVSDSTGQALRRFGIKDVRVVLEGFEPPEAPVDVVKETRPTLVWCARVVEYKRPMDLVVAASRLVETIPDLQVWLMGGGPQLDEVRAAAPPCVEVTGRVSEEEKFDRMARAHVHVATSMREGWGLVVSEAAALGTPTVSYDVPGLRDSTRAAKGIVIPPSPDALVSWLPVALDRWMANPPGPLAYGGAHSWDEVADVVLAELLDAAGFAPQCADGSVPATRTQDALAR